MSTNAFKRNLAIFLGVNVLGAIGWAVIWILGIPVTGPLWIYPTAMAIWGLAIAVQGYRAQHEPVYPEARIRREIEKLS